LAGSGPCRASLCASAGVARGKRGRHCTLRSEQLLRDTEHDSSTYQSQAWRRFLARSGFSTQPCVLPHVLEPSHDPV
jgi:hypothetical protein